MAMVTRTVAIPTARAWLAAAAAAACAAAARSVMERPSAARGGTTWAAAASSPLAAVRSPAPAVPATPRARRKAE